MKTVLVDKEKHAQTKVARGFDAKFGDNIHLLPVTANEIRSLVRDYAVVITQHPETKVYSLNVLLGFEPQENLYLRDGTWDASYVPLNVQRQPFFLSVDQENNRALISLDEESGRLNEEQGEAIFDEKGEATPYFDHVNKLLTELMSSAAPTEAFVKALADNDLIEPITVNVTFTGEEERHFQGLFAISEKKLSGLSDELLKEFYEKSYLPAMYLMASSLGHINKLVGWRNKQHSA